MKKNKTGITFTLQKDELLKALKFVYKSLPSNPQLPILSSILLSLKDGSLSLSSTDLYFGIQSKIATSSKEDLVIAVPGALFKEVILSLDDDLINFLVKEGSIIIKSNGGVVKIPTQDPIEFPDFPTISTKKLSLCISVIKEIEEFVCFAAGVDQARPILTTLLLKVNDNTLTAVSTDGFRLSVLELKNVQNSTDGESNDQEILIPAKYFSEIYQIALTYQVEKVQIFVDNSLKQLKVKVGNNDVYIRQIDGEYPPYQKIIPDDSSFISKVEVDKKQLLKEVKRAAIFSKQDSGVVSLGIEKSGREGKVIVESVSSSRGSYKGVVLTENSSGDEVKTAFNSDYLKDFLSIDEKESASIQIIEELKPAVFKIVGKENLKYIIMPFRVNQ